MKVGSLVKYKHNDRLYIIVSMASNPFFGWITVVASPVGFLGKTYDMPIFDLEVLCK